MEVKMLYTMVLLQILFFYWIFVLEHENQNDLEVTLTVQLQPKGHTGTETCIFIWALFEISALSLIFLSIKV